MFRLLKLTKRLHQLGRMTIPSPELTGISAFGYTKLFYSIINPANLPIVSPVFIVRLLDLPIFGRNGDTYGL